MRPATDAVAKELLPIYDTPLLKFAIDEAVAAGARRIVLVTRPSKRGFRSYIDRIQSAPGSSLKGIEVVFAEQEEPLGLGHAVLCARDFALPGPVGVILPDDLIFGEPTLPAMCKAFAADQMQCLVAAQKVDRSEVKNYGIFDLGELTTTSPLMPARDLVEKPDPADAPSEFAVVGRYVLSERIWAVLERTRPGAGDEIQLTDAVTALGGLHAFRFSGQRYDCGNKEGWFAATEAFRKHCLETEALAAE
jgi:UTP--glucose-1-phosphate uridylyltransferase